MPFLVVFYKDGQGPLKYCFYGIDTLPWWHVAQWSLLRGEAIVCLPVRAVLKNANKNIVYLYSVDVEHGIGSIATFKYSRQIGFLL